MKRIVTFKFTLDEGMISGAAEEDLTALQQGKLDFADLMELTHDGFADFEVTVEDKE